MAEGLLSAAPGLLVVVVLSICCSFVDPPGGIVDEKRRRLLSLPLLFALLVLSPFHLAIYEKY